MVESFEQFVSVFSEPFVEFGVRGFCAEGDCHGLHMLIVVSFEDADPELAVVLQGECCGHRVSRYAEADLMTPDSPEGATGPRTRAARTSYRAVRFAHQELTKNRVSTCVAIPDRDACVVR